MFRRIPLMAVAAVAIAAAVVVPAGAKSHTSKAAPSKVTIVARSGTKYVINRYAQDTSRFTPGVITIKSGGTLTLKNRGGMPHTFSLVKASQLPKTTKQIDKCKVCNELAKAHQADPTSDAPPKIMEVNVGADGYDQPGDSVFFIKTQKLKITAKRGTTLHFICAIHPWMQGTIKVK